MPRKINVYSLGKVYCKRFYAKTPPSYPLQLPLTQGESWYFFSKMVSNSTLPLFVEGVLERGREFMDYKLVYKFQK